MERFLNFLILYDLPDWLRREDLPRLLPSVDVPSIASLRSWVALVDESTINAVCPPRPRCYGEDARRVAGDVLSEVFDEIFRFGGERDRAGRLLGRIDEIIERGVRGIEPVVCTELKSLGCFIPADERDGSREPAEIASYPGPLILVSMEWVSRVSMDLSERYGEILSEWEKERVGRYLLESVIAHEVTHAYTDTAHEEAPAKVLREHTQPLYYEVIEESLATYFGLAELLRHGGILGHILTVHLLNNAPIEYRAGYLWHTLLGRELTNTMIEKWVTGTSMGTYIAAIIPYAFIPPTPRYYYIDLLHELRRRPAIAFQETPIQLWKILTLELIKSAKPLYLNTILQPETL